MRLVEADYIIVGGGTAGCVLANELTQDRSSSVVMIETGPRYNPVFLGAPLASLRYSGRFMSHWHTTPQRGAYQRRVHTPTGRVLGGGSSVNAMIFNIGHPVNYDEWRDAGNRGWGWLDMLPYLREVERRLPASMPAFRHPFSEVFVSGLAELGYRRNDGFVDGSVESAGVFRVAQRHGRRASAATAFLRPARHRSNLTTLTGTRVRRVLIEHGRAVGVEYEDDEGVHQARARREVVVSAGAVGTPHLLMLSGLGPAAHLTEFGIDVVADLPGVGQNLRDHLRLPVAYGSPYQSGTRQVVSSGALPFVAGRGIITSNNCESGGFVSCGPESRVPNVQYVTHWRQEADASVVDFEPCLVDAHSTGSVRLASADPAAAPLIDPGYLRDPRDVDVLVAAVRQCREIARTRSLRDAGVQAEVAPGFAVADDDDIAAYVRVNIETCFHFACTARMGHDADAVVDDELRVHGVSQLRVVDASIMPTLINSNTSGPTMAIALKAARLIRGLGDRSLADDPAHVRRSPDA